MSSAGRRRWRAGAGDTSQTNSGLCRFFEHPGWEKGNATRLADRATDCVLSCQTGRAANEDLIVAIAVDVLAGEGTDRCHAATPPSRRSAAWR